MNDLTVKEIDILIDVLEVWESKNIDGEFISSLMTNIISENLTDEGKEIIRNINLKNKLESEQKMRERKDKSILLKAKLINIKQELILQEANNIIKDDKIKLENKNE